MTPDETREKWRSGEATLGLWAALPDPFAVELAAVSGLDYICLDQQHGLIGYSELVAMLPSIERHGVLALTRVPANDPAAIARSLDAGAMGVVVPMVNDAVGAAKAVEACRYAPYGTRSFGPIRAALSMGRSDPRSLESVLCVVMVETEQGISNLDEIVSVPGLDAIYVGPADLAVSLGIPPSLESTDARHTAAIEEIRLACVKGGIAAGIQCTDGAFARERVEAGFQMVTFAKDSSLLQSAVRAQLLTARGDLHRSGPVGYT